MSEEERKNEHDERDRECRELVHVHTYDCISEVADDHDHWAMGVSSPARMVNGSHIHRLKGRENYVDGHWHAYDICTGPAIQIGDGMHIHYFEGTTSEADGHEHGYAGVTGLAPDMGCFAKNQFKYKRG